VSATETRADDSTGQGARAFDALRVPAALLDADGVIVACNEAWQDFTIDGGGRGEGRTGELGDDYLAVVAGWPDREGRPGTTIAAGIREVLGGGRSVLVFEHPSPQAARRVLLRVVPSATSAGMGAVVFHAGVSSPTRSSAGPPVDRMGLAGWAIDDRSGLGPTDPSPELALLPRASLLDAVGEAILVLDPDGQVFYLNRAAEELYGWSAEEALGQSTNAVAPSNLGREEVRSILDRVRGGEDWTGEVVITRRGGRRFPAQVNVSALCESGQVVALVASAVDRTDRAVAEAEATHHATHDGLTGLRNRVSLLDAIDHDLSARGELGAVAVALVDLDGFRQHNEAYGLPAGDQLLRDCAAVLTRAAHGGDTVARYSGASFAVCCPHLHDESEAQTFADHIRRSVGRPMLVDDLEIRLRSTVGVALDGWDAVGAAEIVRAAEMALQRAKDAGRNQTLVYDDAMRAEVQHQVQIEHLVRRAVAIGEVALAYQPVTNLADQEVVGAEALLRMTDDDLSAIPPPAAIAAAERCGLGDEFGTLVLRTACAEAARWQRQLPERTLTVSVNLSAGQLRDRQLPDHVRAALEDSGLDPSRLGLEVSEGVLMQDVTRAVRQLARLRTLGVRLSADDFGTGSSSLAMLKRLPLDAIKADISFVSGLPDNPEDLAIVTAMMGVANALGLRVVAEGVENAEQLAELRRLGCGYGQGYHWSPAIGGVPFLKLAAVDVGPATVQDGADGPPEPPPEPERAQDVVDDLDVVFRALAHEIRTPLTVAMGYASLLEATLEGEDATAATSIRRASERIDHLIRSLEDVRMIDQGALRLDLATTDIREVTRQVAAEMATVLGRSVQLIHDRPEPLLVEVDRPRIEQVLTNLVANAAKYSGADEPVTLAVVADREWIDVAVADEGPGVAVADLGLIFRKYARADRTRPGSGLGLYLARGTARAHGGDIVYRRGRYGRGSVFSLRIPSTAPTP